MTRSNPTALVRWLVLLGGPLAWAMHFLIIYAVASLELTLAWQAGWISRLIIGVVTLVAGGIVLALAHATRKGRPVLWGRGDDPLQRFWRYVTVILCLLSLTAILWQALPAVLIPVDTVSHDSDLYRSQRE